MTKGNILLEYKLLKNLIYTVKYLSWRQIIYQLKNRITRKGISLVGECSPGLDKRLRGCWGNKIEFVSRWTGGEFDLSRNTFSFIGISKTYHKNVNWNDKSFGGLWLDHLHYFRYLELSENNEKNAIMNYQLIMNWNKHKLQCEKAFYPPYNASERAFCMGRWLLLSEGFLTKDQFNKVLLIIYQDIDFVARNLEWHLDGNHLLKNITAVWWGVEIFDKKFTTKWRGLLNNNLNNIINNQTLKDGMHYEKSYVYHQLALIDFLDIYSIMKVKLSDSRFLNGVIKTMYSSMKYLTHPDGTGCLFNDSPLNLSSSSMNVLSYCQSLNLNSGDNVNLSNLKESGYIQLSNNSGYYIIIDAGSLGPDEQPGHAHSDMLHFEMSFLEYRVLVEGGTSSYYDRRRRPYERSTEAHNTVTVNRKSQSENWGNFRVAERGHCKVIECNQDRDVAVVCAEHDGFKAKYGIIHRRSFKFKEGVFSVNDVLLGQVDPSFVVESYLHFSKDCVLELDGDILVINISNKHFLYISTINIKINFEPMEYAIKYNQLLPGTRVRMEVLNNNLEFGFFISESIEKIKKLSKFRKCYE